MTETLYVVIPAYNEEENIESVIKSWYPVLEGKSDASRVVVADSGSTDRTHEILSKLQQELPKLFILSSTGKFHGPKVIALYEHAIKSGADWIFQTDSDGQTNPAEFDAFWNIREGLDGIFGNRSVRGDGLARSLVEKVVCLLLKIYFGIRVPDANAPFRLMKAGTVNKYLHLMAPDYNLPNIMITAFFSFYDENVSFRQISFKARQGGVNSINILKIMKIGWKALRDFSKFRKQMKRDAANAKNNS